MQQYFRGSVLCALGVFASAVQAAVLAPHPTPPNGLTFKSVLDLKQKPTGIEPQLRGGSIATSLEWPASLYATFTLPQGTYSCTAVLVGPKVMATAAHCVPPDGKVEFILAGVTHRTTCDRHPDYVSNSDASADFALCLITTNLQPPAGFLFEKFDHTAMKDLVGSGLVLTGYGCTSDVVGAGAPDGNYRIGLNTVAETSLSSPPSFDADLYHPDERNNLFTAHTGANLCPGDSGGPTFRLVSGTRTGGTYANRVIVGINSRVFYTDQTRKTYGSSLVSATGAVAFREWGQEWAKKNEVDVCGLAGSLATCR